AHSTSDARQSADAPHPATTTQNQPDRAPRGPANVQIDFDGLAQRIIATPGVPSRQYTRLKPGAPGTVFYKQTAEADDDGGGRGGAAAGSTILRYRLSDRRAATF